jgi:molybdopterin/thiamine biosynthesis adenylyltransferase
VRPDRVGVGAVGCALLYALIAAGASGTLLLLDPDTVRDSNLMRYILFDARHLDKTKIAAATEIVVVSGLDLEVESVQTVIHSYLKRHPLERERLHLVVAAVDTYEARREIAGELPREIVNAGTTPRDFTVSRHGFADGHACLACLYPARKHDIELSAVIARELGLDKTEVAELRRTKRPLTAGQLERVAAGRGLAADAYAAYVGEPLDSFYNKEFCAKVPVQTARGGAVAALAFGSAFAGFLLAHALAYPDEGEARQFRMDVFGGLGTPLRKSSLEHDDCTHCGRRVFRQAYAARWHSEAA